MYVILGIAILISSFVIALLSLIREQKKFAREGELEHEDEEASDLATEPNPQMTTSDLGIKPQPEITLQVQDEKVEPPKGETQEFPWEEAATTSQEEWERFSVDSNSKQAESVKKIGGVISISEMKEESNDQ